MRLGRKFDPGRFLITMVIDSEMISTATLFSIPLVCGHSLLPFTALMRNYGCPGSVNIYDRLKNDKHRFMIIAFLVVLSPLIFARTAAFPSPHDWYTVKPVLSGHSKIDKTKASKTGGSLIQVSWSILQYV